MFRLLNSVAMVAACSAVVSFATSATAQAIVHPVAATASSSLAGAAGLTGNQSQVGDPPTGTPSFGVAELINGSGIDIPGADTDMQDPTDVTATSTQFGGSGAQNQWVSAVGVTSGIQLDFDLGGSFDLSSAVIWNGNQQASLACPTCPGRDVNELDILVSSDGMTFTSVVGGSTNLAQIVGGISEATDAFLPEIVEFDALAEGVTDVRFNIISIHNTNEVVAALNEVRFIAAVPEPSSLCILALGALAPLARRRRS